MRAERKIVSVIAVGLLLSLNGCSRENPRVTTRRNQAASLAGDLSFNPLQGGVITSWLDKRNSTMSTLFGNDAAVRYARANGGRDFPAGSIISLVTWKQQEDERWFGGKIPAAAQSVEIVAVGMPPSLYSYRKYEGTPLQLVTQAPAAGRAVYLLSQRAAVMP